MPGGLSGADALGVDAAPQNPESDPSVAAIVLAAGRSTRMRSRLPKPLHPICGLPMTTHVIRACREAGASRIVVVVGHEADFVRSGLGSDWDYVVQQEQRGTGDAVRAAESVLGNWPGTILVIAGDVPLVPAASLSALLREHRRLQATATLLTATIADPTGYGRVVRDPAGRVARIVEERDATDQERTIKEWNPSIYAFRASALWPALAEIRPVNAQGEYYLTDVVEYFVRHNYRVDAVEHSRSSDLAGVNTRVELAEVTERMRKRKLNSLMLAGITIIDPASTYIDIDVEIGPDTVVEPSSHLIGAVRVGSDCSIGPMARIINSTLGNRVRVLTSQVDGSVLDDGVKVGPFANIRPGTHLGPDVKIGDFVEVKNATLGMAAQASHLSYIGDADIGAQTNIGAGVITCNYDGYRKHRTIIGSGVFVGSNSTLVAPVTVGDGAFVAAASAVTTDVPEEAMLIARSHPTVKEGWAARYHEKQRAANARAGDEKSQS